MRKIFLISLFLLSLSSCGDRTSPERQEAMNLLDQARDYQSKEAFTEALACLDSALLIAPTDTLILREELNLRRAVQIDEARKKLISSQEIFNNLQEEAVKLKKNFSYVYSTYYENEPYFQHPRFEFLERRRLSHLRFRLDTLGHVQISSVYVGSRPLKHDAVCLRHGQESFKMSPVPFDKALNYRYCISGTYWEIVNYRSLDNELFSRFVKNHNPKSLTLEFLRDDKVIRQSRIGHRTMDAIRKSLELADCLYRQDSVLKEESKYARRFIRLNKED